MRLISEGVRIAFADRTCRDHHRKGCWLFTDKNGEVLPEHDYGTFSGFKADLQDLNCGNKPYSISYIIETNLEIPKGMVIRHTCDIPACVRPDHLLSGTHQDNMIDCIQRNRGGSQTINTYTARLIYNACARGSPVKQVALEFSVSVNVVSKIKRKAKWKHIHEY